MARNKQLSQLVSLLRSQTGRSQSVSIGVSELDNLKDTIRRHYEHLYEDYDWPHLRIERSITINAGQRYYDMPDDMDFDRIEEIKYKYGNVYVPVERGISFDDYSIFDSNADERSSPMLKWDIRNTGTKEQIEIWPISNTSASLHFVGIKKFTPLIQEADRALLDDWLVVLHAAAEVLARQESPDAEAKAVAADRRYMKLKGNSKAQSKPIQIGLGNRQLDDSNRLKTRIIVS